MDSVTAHLRALAWRVTDAALELVPLRAALLAGSAARGDADFFSDVDLLLYVDELPGDAVLPALRAAVGGTSERAREPTENVVGEDFDVDGVRVDLAFTRVAFVASRLDALLDGLEAVGSPSQKALAGIAEGVPLHGRELVEAWQGRVRRYPDALQRAMVEHHWHFFPLWNHADAIAARDAELWRLDVLLDASFNLLGVLAGLNRVYFARFELKRVRAFVAKLELAPPRLADRLESLFSVPPAAAADELGRLVLETRELVRRELPDLELPLRHDPGERQRPWR